MNILMLNYEFPPLGGGAANATFYLLKEFAKNPSVTIDLVTSSVAEQRIERFADNITIHYLDIGKQGNLHYQSNKDLLRYSWKSLKYAKRLKKEKSYDLVHAFFGIPCGYIARKLKLPYIVSLRGSDVPFYNERFKLLDKLFFKRLSKRIWKKAAVVITNSDKLTELAHQSAPSQEISVIYNGVDTEQFSPGRSSAKEQGKIVVVSTGRLIERKGYRYLIKAMQGLDDFSLVLVGDGNQKEELQQLAEANGVDLSFAGKQDKEGVISYLRSADLFALPSMNEGMSNSVLEAMACGLPLLLTDVGGTSELLDENGIVVPVGSVSALRAGLLKYGEQPKMVHVHGARSRKLAEKMSWKKVADKYLESYQICAGS